MFHNTDCTMLSPLSNLYSTIPTLQIKFSCTYDSVDNVLSNQQVYSHYSMAAERAVVYLRKLLLRQWHAFKL